MKSFVILLVLAMALALAIDHWRVLDGLLSSTPPAASPLAIAPTVTDVGPTVEKIAGLSSLTTLQVDVADAVVSELPGRTGSVRAVLVVKGNVMLGVDLSAAAFAQVDRENHRAVLTLPQPKVTLARLDQERTRFLEVRETGLWAIVPGGEEADTAAVNRALRDAQRMVGAAVQDPELIQRCREQTEIVLRSFLKALGWEVEIRWAAQ